jgi:protein involved in polysaccharide export with SLBB domain
MRNKRALLSLLIAMLLLLLADVHTARSQEPSIERARVVGAVTTPQWIYFKASLTLTRAIAMVGGVLRGSHTERVIITRQTQGSVNAKVEVNLEAIIKGRAPDIVLQPNDIVYVPGKKSNGCCSGMHVLTVILSAEVATTPRVIH